MPAEALEAFWRAKGRLEEPVQRFLRLEAAAGIVLLVMTAVAMLWANLEPDGYRRFVHLPLQVGIGTWRLEGDLHFFVNEVLMSVFFLLVGLEIKREMVFGELSNVRRASLPVIAAMGGMVGPALLFRAINASPPQSSGVAIPTATDIAFAVGVLLLLGKRIPGSAQVFLLALAVADDLGAVAVINLFYSSDLRPRWLVLVAFALIALWTFRLFGVRSWYAYLLPGVAMWIGFHHAHLHPTLAGVFMGLLIPVQRSLEGSRFRQEVRSLLAAGSDGGHDGQKKLAAEVVELAEEGALSPLERMEMYVQPRVNFLILPLFALVNGGVAVSFASLASEGATRVALGVAFGLFVGKLVGIFGATMLAVRLNFVSWPDRMGPKQLLLVALLGGIGFTMANFTAELAFLGDANIPLRDAAKLGILAGSFASGLCGYAYGKVFLREEEGAAPPEIAEASDVL